MVRSWLQAIPRVRTAGTWLAPWLLAGCALGTTVHTDGTVTRRYFGYVEVQRPAPVPGQVFSDDTSVIGLRISNGFGLGYLRDRQLVVPLDCRLVVVVRTQAQLDEAIARMNSSARPCGVVDGSMEEGR